MRFFAKVSGNILKTNYNAAIDFYLNSLKNSALFGNSR